MYQDLMGYNDSSFNPGS